MRERPNDKASRRGCFGLFASESKEEEWNRIKQELKEHLRSINRSIYSDPQKKLDVYSSLRTAYATDDGPDGMDALSKEIYRLHREHRSTISYCERSGEIVACCCVILLVLTNCKMGEPPPPTTLWTDDFGYENPTHRKSPYKDLAEAVNAYTAWYKQIPEEFKNTNFKDACKRFKRDHLAYCEEKVIPVSRKSRS